jgi:dimethylhistidine N-methyltransferase
MELKMQLLCNAISTSHSEKTLEVQWNSFSGGLLTMENVSVVVHDLDTKKDNILEEVLNGLNSPIKTIHAKYFYDKRGSELFEQITETDEYYQTRTEILILEKYTEEIAKRVGKMTTLIEYGSGSSKKIKTLLASLHSLKKYMPIDISRDFLLQSCLKLSLEFPELKIEAVCGDYMHPLLLPLDHTKRKVVFFPGSTIGNFEPNELYAFLNRTSNLLKSGDGFIIGVDVKKETHILNAAYNDRRGITKAFNLNVLNRINQELGSDFQVDQFEHVAFYNEEKGRIEMHLKSTHEQQVAIGPYVISFQKGEHIHTENSYKYTVPEFQAIVYQCGFDPLEAWMDENQLFSVHYMEKI